MLTHSKTGRTCGRTTGRTCGRTNRTTFLLCSKTRCNSRSHNELRKKQVAQADGEMSAFVRFFPAINSRTDLHRGALDADQVALGLGQVDQLRLGRLHFADVAGQVASADADVDAVRQACGEFPGIGPGIRNILGDRHPGAFLAGRIFQRDRARGEVLVGRVPAHDQRVAIGRIRGGGVKLQVRRRQIDLDPQFRCVAGQRRRPCSGQRRFPRPGENRKRLRRASWR